MEFYVIFYATPVAAVGVVFDSIHTSKESLDARMRQLVELNDWNSPWRWALVRPHDS